MSRNAEHRAITGGQNPFLRTIHLDQGEPNGTGPDLAGYASVDELVKAYRSSSQEGQRQRTRADQAEYKVGLLEQQGQPRQPVAQRTRPEDRLADYGIPVDALEEYVGSRVEAAFAPIARGAMARNSMLTQYDDYQKFEADVAQFIQEDPTRQASYQRMFREAPQEAMEWAFLKYGQEKRGTVPNEPAPQAAARAEAQIPSNRAGDARHQPAAADEALARAFEVYQKTGNGTAYAKARLRQAIPDDFLNR